MNPLIVQSTGDAAFLDPCLTPSTADRFVVRTAILRELKNILSQLNGVLLDVGCGQMPYRPLLLSNETKVTKYIGIDMPTSRYGIIQPDIIWDGRRLPFENNAADCALLTEVLEHCPEPVMVLTEVNRVLKPGGMLFLTVPFLWPLHEVPYDEVRYTPFAMQRHLEQSGFANINLKALGGWDASLAQLIGLWVCRRGLHGWKKRILSSLAVRVMRSLLARDVIPPKFRESTMITGLAGTAFKPELK
jgi:SAM-dependent methyltransferase